MATPARAWAQAVTAARAVVFALDAVETMGAIDEDGNGTLKLVNILVEKMHGQPIPFNDRNGVDEAWRGVLLVVQEGASEGQLSFCNGEPVDEHDTPAGRLALRDSNNSLASEFGMYYNVP